ncbi:MAG: hypothetical protein NT154_07260 [Verrucomicrobia bacterium]|nr:hypothetical protein [Verrucomicrobiota bacterium]
MPAISINATISSTNGPTVNFKQSISVEACDQIAVLSKANTHKPELDPPPGGQDKVHFLLSTSDWHGEALSSQLDDAAGAAPFRLDSPQLLPGQGASAMLYALSPNRLLFANSKSVDANIHALGGTRRHPVNEITP